MRFYAHCSRSHLFSWLVIEKYALRRLTAGSTAAKWVENGYHKSIGMDEAHAIEEEGESEWGSRVLLSAWDRAQATSGRGRRGEEARREARRLRDLATQVVLANKSKCVLCGQPTLAPNGAAPALSASTIKSGLLPRFG